MRELARFVRKTPRRLPLDVALELDVGMGRGGMSDARELEACLKILRANRGRPSGPCSATTGTPR